jgi:regulator of protease activity HflC (stomatin/prohibitin superfamily)
MNTNIQTLAVTAPANPGVLFFLGLLVAAILVLAALGIKIVRHSETMVIERLGRYHRTLRSGLNVIWPIIDRPRAMVWRYRVGGEKGASYMVNKVNDRIDLRESVYDFPRQNVITRDNVAIEINALVYFQITDAMKSVYEIENLPDAIEKLTQTTLRNIIGELDFDQCLISRDTINKRLGLILDEATDKWGVKINRVELQDITPPRDVQAAMEKQMRAERDRRALVLSAEGAKQAAILEAEGIREAEISRADGQRQASVLRATGEAEAMERLAAAEANVLKHIAQGLGNNGKTDPATYAVALRYLESLKSISSGQNNKTIYMPYEATGMLSSLGGLKDLFSHDKK